MTRLWLVRHGPTHARGMAGWTDLPADLSDRGALARLSALLPQAPVVSSDLIRARATAEAIAGARPRLRPEPDLREMHFGRWEMRRHAEAEAEDPALARALWEAPGDCAPPGGESWNALAGRVGRAVERLLGRQEEHLILVCHFGPILTLVQRALGVAPAEVFGQDIAPLSLSEIAAAPGGWRLCRINHRP